MKIESCPIRVRTFTTWCSYASTWHECILLQMSQTADSTANIACFNSQPRPSLPPSPSPSDAPPLCPSLLASFNHYQSLDLSATLPFAPSRTCFLNFSLLKQARRYHAALNHTISFAELHRLTSIRDVTVREKRKRPANAAR